MSELVALIQDPPGTGKTYFLTRLKPIAYLLCISFTAGASAENLSDYM